MVIPIFDKLSRSSIEWIALKNVGPTKIPARIYPTISGCLRSRITIETTVAIKIIFVNSKNISIYSLYNSRIRKRISYNTRMRSVESPQSIPEQSIPLEAFMNRPSITPIAYNDDPPQMLTRETFTRWMIDGFAISRGRPEKQAAYYIWTGVKGNFDPFSTIDHFLQGGGYGCLSGEERQTVDTAFNRVEGHFEAGEATVTPLDINEQLQYYANKENFFDRERDSLATFGYIGGPIYKLLPENVRSLPNYEFSLGEVNTPYAVVKQQWQRERDEALRIHIGSLDKNKFTKVLRTGVII
jgi:hypothetical protein